MIARELYERPTTRDELDAMRCLTVLQPMAAAIMHGGKRIENRPLRLVSSLPRLIVVHAGSAWYAGGRQRPTKRLLPATAAEVRYGWAGRVPTPDELEGAPLRALLGVMRISSCVTLEGVLERRDLRFQRRWAFGPWCWLIDRVWALPEPIPWSAGALGLWHVPDEHRDELEQLVAGRWEP